MQGELLNQGLMLMLVGMGTVFVFLTILVILTALMSRLVLGLQPAPSAEPDDEEVAAIAAAIAAHRRNS